MSDRTEEQYYRNIVGSMAGLIDLYRSERDAERHRADAHGDQVKMLRKAGEAEREQCAAAERELVERVRELEELEQRTHRVNARIAELEAENAELRTASPPSAYTPALDATEKLAGVVEAAKAAWEKSRYTHISNSEFRRSMHVLRDALAALARAREWQVPEVTA